MKIFSAVFLGVVGASALVVAPVAIAQAQSSDARRFGALESVEQISLSPDGTRVVFLTPVGKGNAAMVGVVGSKEPARPILRAVDDSSILTSCRWASATRILCSMAIEQVVDNKRIGFSRMLSLAVDGSDGKVLSAADSRDALGIRQNGGRVIDWQVGDGSGQVLMTRAFVPEYTTGSHATRSREGLGVEQVDPVTLKRKIVEPPRKNATAYISDQHGNVRVMGFEGTDRAEMLTGETRYYYRKAGSRDWVPLSTTDASDEDSGFSPYAVDAAENAVYGFENKDGRRALYRISLDGSLKRELVFARPDVDVDSLVRLGRSGRVVGVSWATDKRHIRYFDPKLTALADALSKALPGLPQVSIIDASDNEQQLLLWAGGDTDPGHYYVFDKPTRQLKEIILARPALVGVTLAPVKPMTYTASDGTQIPAYLTLPVGKDPRGLPAIVMPHGGPSARDEWGFDWLAQYFAARGYAVIQPNYRGSSGYGDSWFVDNGFKSWRTAIGDIDDAGRWLLKQGIADPDKLAIVGWSYGGYAALQSGVLEPGLFKAIVAVAPVTDLARLKRDAEGFTNARLVQRFVGDGPHVDEGSPAQHADRIIVPVLIFHGDRDTNVDVGHARLMEDRLRARGKRVELVIYRGLDHQLHDAAARAELLEKSDAFLRKSFGK